MKKYQIPLILLLLAILVTVAPETARADSIGLIARGIGRTITSVFQLPISILTESIHSFPLGIITGTINGLLGTITGTVSGTMDIARGAAPYAKYLIFML